ncbi:MAG: thioredoxin [Muribaculaceae bacterium]|nr:thioredoxin [Muribaculaceae bacterium]
MMKTRFIAIVILLSSILGATAATSVAGSKVREINQTEFKSLVSDYDNPNTYLQLKGDKPVIIDFTASWCGPCKKLAPILEELATEYTGKIDFYKIDIDKNKQLAEVFHVKSVPMLVFISLEGKVQEVVGLYPKEEVINVINYVFPAQKK